MRNDQVVAIQKSPVNWFARLRQFNIHRCYTLIKKLAQEPSIRTTAVFALSGLAFSVGTLLLARNMSIQAFGHVALAIAMFNIFALLAPVGIDQIALRQPVNTNAKFIGRLLVSGMSMGFAVGLIYMWSAELAYADALAMTLAIASGGIIATIASMARSVGREATALSYATAASWILLLIGLVSWQMPMKNALVPLSMFAGGNVAVAVWGWLNIHKTYTVGADSTDTIPWGEALPLLSIAAIGTIVLQLERLIIPAMIDIQALALFSVLASVAIFPFRLLTSSAGFSLVPKLRTTSDARLRRKLVRKEFFAMLCLLLLATAGILILAPYATDIVTNGRYQLSLNLTLAACINGSAKVLQALPRAVLTGCGDAQQIAQLNRWGVFGLLASIVGAIAGAHWGLTGLLYGVAIGSMAGSVPAILLARTSLR